MTEINRRANVVLWKAEFLLLSYSSIELPNSPLFTFDGHVERLPEDASDVELGARVLRVLAHDVGPLPRPNYRVNPRPRYPVDDLMNELGVTEKVFDKKGAHCAVYRISNDISVEPFVYDRGHLRGVPERDVVLPATVDSSTLGRTVRAALSASATGTGSAGGAGERAD